MDGLSDILTAISNAKTPLAIFIILAVVLAAIVWQVSKRAELSEATTQLLVRGGYGLVALLIAAGVATVFLMPKPVPPPPPPQATNVTITGKAFAGGDQRKGLAGATVHLEPLEDFAQRNVTTDTNGEFSTDFVAKRMVTGVVWANEDKYNETSTLIFAINPADPAPVKQLINMGDPLPSVAANTPPSAPPQSAPGPTAAPSEAPAPAPPASSVATSAATAPNNHHFAFNPALTAAHTLALTHSAIAAVVLSPKPPPVQAVAANPAPGAAAPAVASIKPRMDYDALFAKIETDEVALSNAATAAFDDGQWVQTIRFIQQAQKVSKTGVWKLAYPKLAAAYFLTGQEELGRATVAAIKAERAKPGSILASPVAQRYFVRDAATISTALAPADKVQIDSALH